MLQCHNTDDWLAVSFSLVDCVACHSADRPTDHYVGQCSACHTTNAWDDVNFDHGGYTDCQSCHGADLPADHHFAVQCSTCHNTAAWSEVSVSRRLPGVSRG